MSARLPNGSTFDLASTYGSPLTVSAITNANPAVATSTAHGLSNGDTIELTTGWTRLNGRLFRVSGVTTNTFELEDIDTSNTAVFPAAGGAGSAREITAFVRITQVTDVATSGGEQKFYEYGFLEEYDDRQTPTSRSPQSFTITVADDSTQAFVPVAEAYDQSRARAGLRLNLPAGDTILYAGICTFSESPALTRNQLMTRAMTFSLEGRPTRYNA